MMSVLVTSCFKFRAVIGGILCLYMRSAVRIGLFSFKSKLAFKTCKYFKQKQNFLDLLHHVLLQNQVMISLLNIHICITLCIYCWKYCAYVRLFHSCFFQCIASSEGGRTNPQGPRVNIFHNIGK